jgi:hypothetical protein
MSIKYLCGYIMEVTEHCQQQHCCILIYRVTEWIHLSCMIHCEDTCVDQKKILDWRQATYLSTLVLLNLSRRLLAC